MRWRRTLGALVLVALLAAAGTALVRSTGPAGRSDPVEAVAASLRCPACQGESVVDSRSPIAASMRQVVADQVAQGRSPDEIRRWFVQRYGEEVLADPPARGVFLLLWAVPVLVLLGVCYAAVRTARPRGGPATRQPAADRPVGPGLSGRTAGRAWWAASLGLVATMASVTVAARQLDRPAPAAPADPVTVAVRLAQDLEQQQRYAAAAQMYGEALRDRPDDTVRLRLAFALLRSGDATGAERTSRDVLTRSPDSPDGLLVLGLAQRGTHPTDAPGTLRRFLAVAPEHPAAAEIRRLLAGASPTAGGTPAPRPAAATG
ncbi:cytochrome c-type biogenesis protein CcmH [Micromonospora sp. NPDC047548]|uniref:cytochrome c-type biogenesis protein CcmH n=1 Tax=Micromonospora sp. NPDC047548 TaxID=3155624 RepID=UPI0033DE63D5